jgi:phage baseplate assembly protein W
MADYFRIKQSQSNMNVNTGKTISEIAHIKQSIANILTTPIGSRIMRRDYGSRLFEKIDNPINGELVAEIYSDVVEALFTWEPRFEVEQVIVQSIEKGKITIDLEGSFLKDGKKIVLENIEISSS